MKDLFWDMRAVDTMQLGMVSGREGNNGFVDVDDLQMQMEAEMQSMMQQYGTDSGGNDIGNDRDCSSGPDIYNSTYDANHVYTDHAHISTIESDNMSGLDMVWRMNDYSLSTRQPHRHKGREGKKQNTSDNTHQTPSPSTFSSPGVFGFEDLHERLNRLPELHRFL